MWLLSRCLSQSHAVTLLASLSLAMVSSLSCVLYVHNHMHVYTYNML